MPPGQIIGDGNGNGNNGGGKDSEPFQYYFHPDHLGSTSYITDASGEVYQHLEYFAFGETFVEEHSNTHRTPYLFNGKELDEETGLYYYGARYYDGRTSVFLSVDPLAEKFPGISSYAFVANNPVRFIDPNGEEFTESAAKWFKKLWNNVTNRIEKNNVQMGRKMNMVETGVNKRGKQISSKRANRLAKQVSRLQSENAELSQIANEIIALENSDQIYNVVISDKLSSSSADKAGTIYNKQTGEVDIVLPSNTKIGLFAHEALHAYQFEAGITSLTAHDGNLNILPAYNWLAYDQTDEIAAYKRQGIFGSTHNSLPSEYNNRPKGPVSLRNIPSISNSFRFPPNQQKSILQRTASGSGMAFRINGNTYGP